LADTAREIIWVDQDLGSPRRIDGHFDASPRHSKNRNFSRRVARIRALVQGEG
jgi:hypothetical protein